MFMSSVPCSPTYGLQYFLLGKNEFCVTKLKLQGCWLTCEKVYANWLADCCQNEYIKDKFCLFLSVQGLIKVSLIYLATYFHESQRKVIDSAILFQIWFKLFEIRLSENGRQMDGKHNQVQFLSFRIRLHNRQAKAS